MKKPLKFVLIGLTLLPFIFLLIMILRYHVDTPIWDSWRMIPLFEKTYSGGLTFYDFWQQHNEHRLIFSRLIILVLGRLTSWNTVYEVMFNVLITLGILIIVMKQLKHNFPKLPYFYLLSVFSLLLFNLNQFENWLFGFTLHIFLHVLAIVGTINLLTISKLNWKRLLPAFGLAIVATFTFGTGLIFWPLALALLLLNKNLTSKMRWQMILFWFIVSGITISSYLYHFQANTQDFWLTILNNPVNVILFTLLYLGRPLTLFLYLDTFWGILVSLYALILTTAMIIVLIKRKLVNLEKLLPIILYLVYSIGIGVVIALGRAQYGYEAARASRYITLANLFWIACFSIWFIFYYLVIKQKNVGRILPLSSRWLPVIFTTFISMMVISSLKSISLFKVYSQRFIEERENILNYAKSGELQVFYYTKDFLQENIEILKKRRLSVFRE